MHNPIKESIFNSGRKHIPSPNAGNFQTPATSN
jgi:hypothetical protein